VSHTVGNDLLFVCMLLSTTYCSTATITAFRLNKVSPIANRKAKNYSSSSVKNFNLPINNALAQGTLNWGQMDIIQAKSNTFFSHGDLRSSQNSTSKVLRLHPQCDSPPLEQKDMHCSDWNYTAKCSCNITDPDFNNIDLCRVCDSNQHPMLHCTKR